MDDIVRLYVGAANTTDTSIINSTNGVVIKSIFICNKTSNNQTINFNIDGKDFLFDVESKKTLIIDNVIVCNVLNAKVLEGETIEGETQDLNIFISGLRLGIA